MRGGDQRFDRYVLSRQTTDCHTVRCISGEHGSHGRSEGKLDLERFARGSHHSLQVKLIRLAVARDKLERHTRTARDEPFVVEVSVGPPPQLIDLVGTQRELLAADADAD